MKDKENVVYAYLSLRLSLTKPGHPFGRYTRKPEELTEVSQFPPESQHLRSRKERWLSGTQGEGEWCLMGRVSVVQDKVVHPAWWAAWITSSPDCWAPEAVQSPGAREGQLRQLSKIQSQNIK